MCCIIDQFSVGIEIIKERADIVAFDENSAARLLLRSDAELQGALLLEMKYPFSRALIR